VSDSEADLANVDADAGDIRGDALFITDASAEGETIAATLRGHGYHVVDVPLGLLHSRVVGESPCVVIVDVDQAGAIERVERLREIGGDTIAPLLFIGDPLRAAELGEAQDSENVFERPVDLDSILERVRRIAPETPKGHVARGTTPPPSYAPRPETSRPPGRSDVPASFLDPVSQIDPLDENALLPSDSSQGSSSHTQMSPELEQLLAAAEQKVGVASRRSSFPAAEEEVDLLLPPDVLAILDEPLELGDEDIGTGGGSSAGGRSDQAGSGTRGTRGDGTGSSGTGVSSDEGTGTGTGVGAGTGTGTSIGSPGTGLEGPGTVGPETSGAKSGTQSENDVGGTRVAAPVELAPSAASERDAASGAEPASPHAWALASPATLESGEGLGLPPPLGMFDPEIRNADSYEPPSTPAALAGVDVSSLMAPFNRATLIPTGSASPPTTTPMVDPPISSDVDSAPRTQGSQVPPASLPGSSGAFGGLATEEVRIPEVFGENQEAELIGTAIAMRISGALAMAFRTGVRRIVFHDGDIVTAASGIADETLLSFLAGRGDIEREVARRLGRKLPPSGRHAGAALIAHGHLGQDELWPVLRAHAEWIVARSISGGPGTCELELEPPARLKQEPNVFGGATGAEVFVESIRRVIPGEVAIERLGGELARISHGQRLGLLGECALSLEEEEIARGAAGATVAQLRVQHPELIPVVYALRELGVLSTSAPPGVRADEPSSEDDPLDDEAVRQRVRARLALVEEGNYFDLLGVRPSATPYEVRRAYLTLRRSFEPSQLLSARTADLHDDVRLVLDVLDEAYEILRDIRRKERYRRAIEAGPA